MSPRRPDSDEQVPSGWRKLDKVPRSFGLARRLGLTSDGFELTPFNRLARTHSLMVAADTLLTIAMADSIFFNIDPADARSRVLFFLLLTMAPFAIIAPFVGPAIDRAKGGRRLVIMTSAGLRAIVAFLMIRHLDSLLLFPEAFTMMVLGKAYHISKSAVVPLTVDDEDALVEANSRLSLLSGASGFAFGIPGGLLSLLGGSQWVLGFAVVVLIAAVIMGSRITGTRVVDAPVDDAEKAELRGSGIVLALSAMSLYKGVIGFLTFLLAFELRGGDPKELLGQSGALGRSIRDALGEATLNFSVGSPTWHFGLVVGMGVVGSLAGALAAPRLRQTIREERILTSVMALAAGCGVLAALSGGLAGAVIASTGVSVGSSAGKLSFDSIVQRDAPDANYGRSFARFETRFQVTWVIGAVIAVVVPMGARLGFLLVAATAAFAAVSYSVGGVFTGNWSAAALRDRLAARARVGRASLEDAEGFDPDLVSDSVGSGPDGGGVTEPARRATQTRTAEGSRRWQSGSSDDPVTVIQPTLLDPTAEFPVVGQTGGNTDITDELDVPGARDGQGELPGMGDPTS
ncbi:MAG: MFS transporter [Actinomycetia bacterium]|nr:MFS transporter [Actinomycetes bacterium]MCP4083595.1 MFS transporter [Actinomycetes bacterium]